MKTNNEQWGILWKKDKYNSAESTLQIIDASKDSLSHPQGPTVWATMNVRAVAPHVEEIQRRALLMRAAPNLLSALELLTKAFDALLPGAAHLAIDLGLLNDAALAARAAIREATDYDWNME